MAAFRAVPNARDVIRTLVPHIVPRRLARMRSVLHARVHDTVVVCENLAEEGNLHACLRTADALGIATVHVIRAWGDVSTRSSSMRSDGGAAKWLNLVSHACVEDAVSMLRRDGYAILASDLAPGALPLHECVAAYASSSSSSCCTPFRPRVAIVVGNEHRGVSAALRAASQGRFFIPQAGFVQSLNVSVAFGIAAHAFMVRGKHLMPLQPLDDALDASRVSKVSADVVEWMCGAEGREEARTSGEVGSGSAEPLPPLVRAAVAARWLMLSVTNPELILERAGQRPSDY